MGVFEVGRGSDTYPFISNHHSESRETEEGHAANRVDARDGDSGGQCVGHVDTQSAVEGSLR